MPSDFQNGVDNPGCLPKQKQIFFPDAFQKADSEADNIPTLENFFNFAGSLNGPKIPSKGLKNWEFR